MHDHSEERRRMVERHLEARGVRDPAVLEAMRTVPREAFIAAELAEFAYEDAPLPIEAGQTISQPYIVAEMTAALELQSESSGARDRDRLGIRSRRAEPHRGRGLHGGAP